MVVELCHAVLAHVARLGPRGSRHMRRGALLGNVHHVVVSVHRPTMLLVGWSNFSRIRVASNHERDVGDYYGKNRRESILIIW